MADKLLSESSWKGFAKGKNLDDGAMLKALVKLGKTDEDRPEEWLAALLELEATLNKQIASNAKRKDKDVKDVKERLQDMLALSMKALIQAKAAKAKAAPEHKDDNEDGPALLSTKMIPLVRVLRGDGDARMQALVGVLGSDAVVLITRAAIGASHKRLITGQLGSGVKWSEGTCWFEGGALNFGVDKTPGQLAKKISAALYKQLDMKLKVRVRSDDGAQEESEEASAENAPITSPTDPRADAAKSFNGRLAALLPAIKAAMITNAGASQTLKQQVAQAGALAQAKDFDAAQAVLARIETSLAQAAMRGSDTSTPVLPVWMQAKDSVNDQISRLQTAFRNSRHPLAQDIADKGLNGITRRLQVGLQAALMEYDAASAEQLAAAAARLRSAMVAMRQFLDSDAVLPMLEKNPYGVMVAIRSTLGSALDSIERRLA